MSLIEIKKGQIIHGLEDEVNTIDIVLKGTIKMFSDCIDVNISTGGILGLGETPNEKYLNTYQAMTDATVYSYKYESDNDIEKAILSNPKIANVLASQTVQLSCNAYVNLKKKYEKMLSNIEELRKNEKEYPTLCALVGEPCRTFFELYNIEELKQSEIINSWRANFVTELYKNDAKIRENFYGINASMCSGTVLVNATLFRKILAESKYIYEYNLNFMKSSANFKSIFLKVKAKSEQLKRDSFEDDENVVIDNAIDVILEYANIDVDLKIRFKENVEKYSASSNRTDTSDEMRILRRDIAKDFYSIYVNIFKKTLEEEMVPIEVTMFLMFGFIDEKLAGEEYTKELYKLAKNYESDEDGKVVTLVEWLRMVYDEKVEPSRNEFDADYPTFLREQKAHGEISDAEYNELLEDKEKKLEFEVKNFFTLGNRMSFGRISVFIPIFDKENVQKPLDVSYMSKEVINDILNKIKSIDYSLFYRETVFSDVSKGINQLYVKKEIMPYVILFPNLGTRSSMWQEIEGRRRATPARMLISIFHFEDVEMSFLRICGEYRWEMCKTVQGAYWNNIKDPSLTSEYCDYLQFYKKNSQLSTDQKEKLKLQLKKYSNNFRNVFIADYMTYMKFEVAGSLRLNKVTRGILSTYCAFSKPFREKLKENPQYKEVLAKYDNTINSQQVLISNVIKKLESQGAEIPEDVIMQEKFLKL
ncbi:Crp/Fnr family transcriptional regulator [Lachnobacterium bovis]|uniref:cAMP-binding domain of CRP or a regulatory subunit of cAMP-dependent protein kinases n=1 Tax=Lachnobacterium bovis TaxID=140626 RepID=A0A1H9TGX6_9FIRM|nr:Crp/Fnr family transcriptional regulator [Lachnobacterium bovis]SER96590.1 cAMP-binding domain of CRP or a regulatory subunit of cAMP-dependent protein kinases [Lachnobacterium bovis]